MVQVWLPCKQWFKQVYISDFGFLGEGYLGVYLSANRLVFFSQEIFGPYLESYFLAWLFVYYIVVKTLRTYFFPVINLYMCYSAWNWLILIGIQDHLKAQKTSRRYLTFHAVSFSRGFFFSCYFFSTSFYGK